MATEHLEIERKFDVDMAYVLPDLAEVPGVETVHGPQEHRLEAVYHDTADLRLARSRVTLRRRSGGTDAGWHLKLPAYDGARRELHEPLGRRTKTPPAELQRPLAGLLRGVAVGPVATLHTRRLVTELRDAEGRRLAEVADDEVTATVPRPDRGEADLLAWREIEVELGAGDEALLSAVATALVAAGAVPSSSPSKLARVLGPRLAAQNGAGPGGARKKRPSAGRLAATALRDQVAALLDADLRLRTGGPEAVHDMRVAARRLRSILVAFRGVLDESESELVRAELKWLGGRLSLTRDAEVGLAHRAALVAAQPEELVIGPVKARVEQARVKEAQAAAPRSEALLVEDRYLRLLEALAEVAGNPPLTPAAAEPARAVVLAALRRSGRRTGQRIAAAATSDDQEHLHDVRKAATRLRYTAELARPVLGGRAKAVVRRATDVQETLGHLVDTGVTRELSRTLGLQAAAAGENAWTYGRLHALEEARAARAEADFWTLAPGLQSVLRRAVGKPSGKRSGKRDARRH